MSFKCFIWHQKSFSLQIVLFDRKIVYGRNNKSDSTIKQNQTKTKRKQSDKDLSLLKPYQFINDKNWNAQLSISSSVFNLIQLLFPLLLLHFVQNELLL